MELAYVLRYELHFALVQSYPEGQDELTLPRSRASHREMLKVLASHGGGLGLHEAREMGDRLTRGLPGETD